MKTLHYILGFLFIIITLLPQVKKDHWFIRGFDFPHVQITAINIIILTLFLVFFDLETILDYAFLSILAGCIIHQSFIIFPYTPLAKIKVVKSHVYKPASALSLMVANVYMDNRNSDGCLEIIKEKDPDLLLLVEANKWWCSQLAGELKEKYPYCIEYPLENTYGMLLYSKLLLKDPDIKFLVKEEVPSFHTKVRLESGTEVALHCLHPEPPAPDHSETSTERDAELLIVGKKVVDPDSPTIVVGDLNDVAWSYTTRLFMKISKLLDPRMGRGFFNTFHAHYALLRWPLDHVFISHHFKLLKLQRQPYFGSDHFPIFIQLQHDSDAKDEQEQPEAEREEIELAEEKIEKI